MKVRRRKKIVSRFTRYWARNLPFRYWRWYGTYKLFHGELGTFDGFRVIVSPVLESQQCSAGQ